MNKYQNRVPFIKLVTEQPKEKSLWKSVLTKIPNIIVISISILTFYFGIVQFYYSQNLIDKRKYENDYFDNRTKAFLELAKSTASIHVVIRYKNTLKQNDLDSIKKHLAVFDYTRFFLDRESRDSTILSDMEKYLDQVSLFEKTLDTRNHVALDTLQIKLIQDAGHIFSLQKDSINSFTFSWFPFRAIACSDHGHL